MREEQVIAEVISISKQGEIKNFLVKVPMNANEIIGIETGVRLKGKTGDVIIVPPPADKGDAPVAFPFVAAPPVSFENSVVGELKLQSSEKPNVFYGTLVRDAFAEIDFSNPFAVSFFPEKDWTHGYKKEMEKITIDANTTVISGFYKDFLGESLKRDTAYEIFLAVWFKIEMQKK